MADFLPIRDPTRLFIVRGSQATASAVWAALTVREKTGRVTFVSQFFKGDHTIEPGAGALAGELIDIEL